MIVLFLAVALAVAAGLAVRARPRAVRSIVEDDPDLRRARAETYLQALKWLDAIRLVHEPLAVGNGRDPVPEELRLKRDLASVSELVMLFASDRVRVMFTSFTDEIESRSPGEPISEEHRHQIITIARTMAEEIDGPGSIPRERRRSRPRRRRLSARPRRAA